eukprot:4317_1
MADTNPSIPDMTRATSKVEESTYYHFASTPAEEAEKYKPKKVNGDAGVAPGTESHHGSAWNQGGTWEEKDMSSWAKDCLKEKFLGIASDCGQVKVTSMTKCEGHANIIFVRGKKRIGYDFEIQLEWTGKIGDDKVKGKLVIPELCETDDNFELRVTVSKSNSAHEIARALMRRSKKAVESKVDEFIDEFKNK